MIHPLYYSKIFVDERILIPLSRIFRNFDQWCKNLISLLDTTKTACLWMVGKIQSVFLMTILLNQELVIKAGSRDVVSPDWKVVCLQGWLIKRLPHFIRIRSAFHFFFLILYYAMIQWLSDKESACNAGDTGRRRGFNPRVRKIPWRKEMATHSSILAWKVLCTEEPGGLQSLEFQWVRFNWATK